MNDRSPMAAIETSDGAQRCGGCTHLERCRQTLAGRELHDVLIAAGFREIAESELCRRASDWGGGRAVG
jgi:hypothetical protein